MKKITKTVAIIIMLLLVISPISAMAVQTQFIDVPSDAWYSNDVKIATEMGLINGKTTTTYAPNDLLTYGEAVKLAACMNEKAETGAVTLTNGNPWYLPYVNYAKAKGIISADLDWEAFATRAGYMEIFSKALGNLNEINTIGDGKIPDVPMIHPNAPAIYKLYRAGILQGVDDKFNCNPSANILRSEVAAIITRMMNTTKRLQYSIPDVTAEFVDLVIVFQPESQTAEYNEYGIFRISTSGGVAPISYQWQYNEGNGWKDLEDFTISGRKTPIIGSKTKELQMLAINAVKPEESRNVNIRCVVKSSDSKELISKEVIFYMKGQVKSEVVKPLIIDKQPEHDRSKYVGDPVRLEVVASGGVAPLKYQWQSTMTGESLYLNIKTGGDASILETKVYDNSYDYRCIVTDAVGNSVTSNMARISPGINVIPKPPVQPEEKFVKSIKFLSDNNIAGLESLASGWELTGGTVLRTNLNYGAGGKYIFICYDYTSDPNDALKDLFVVYYLNDPEVMNYMTADHYGKSTWSTTGVNLNQGAGGDYVYLFDTKDTGSSRFPIQNIRVYMGNNPYGDNPGWEVVKMFGSSKDADLNMGTSGDFIYLLMKRKFN
ncbi:MAG: S-layer homology domain-containing protein [Tissierellia bacterium]|nr:S-layer homology domain-containing protein [Tissierellia bacterium]